MTERKLSGKTDYDEEVTRMLKDKIRINQLEVRNRIVMPPMATGKAS